MEGKKTPRGKKGTNNKEVDDISKIPENATHTVKYLYTTFDDLKEQGEYNLFGVIYDASFPLEENTTSETDKKKGNFKYTCILKIIDQTTNLLSHPNNFSDNLWELFFEQPFGYSLEEVKKKAQNIIYFNFSYRICKEYGRKTFIYNKQGEYTIALEYHTKVLETRKSLLGVSHPDIADSYST